jgi:tuftelin-interacting protein 11
MGRKKRSFLSDDSSSNDSDNDGDYEEQELNNDDADERALFEDPYQQRKRRRLNGKSGRDDALYGVFGEDEDEGPIYRRAAPKRKTK